MLIAALTPAAVIKRCARLLVPCNSMMQASTLQLLKAYLLMVSCLLTTGEAAHPGRKTICVQYNACDDLTVNRYVLRPTCLVHLNLLPGAVVGVVQHQRHGCSCLGVDRKVDGVALPAGTQRLSLACIATNA
jgi:hypothetical protein